MSRLLGVLLVGLVLQAGGASARSLHQQQPPQQQQQQQQQTLDLGGLFNEGLRAAGQGIQAILNATTQGAEGAANATRAGVANVTANPFAAIGQALNNITSNALNGTGLAPAAAPAGDGATAAQNGSSAGGPLNATAALNDVGQGIGQFLGNLTAPLTQGLQQQGQRQQQQQGAAGGVQPAEQYPKPSSSGGSRAAVAAAPLACAVGGALALLLAL